MAAKPPAGWYPRRGEIYLAQLDKLRPVLIVSVNALNRHSLDVCVVPMTSVPRREFSLRPALRPGEGGLRTASRAKCDQVTTLEKSLLRYPPLGILSTSTLREVEERVRIALGLA